MSEHPSAAPPPDNVVQGIAPPHSIESEQGVLGAVLLSDRSMYSYVIESQLRPEDFYRERHRVVFGAMVELYGESESIDVLTVTEHLRARAQLEAAGGHAGIDELSAAVPAIGNIKRYGEIVKEMSLLRRLLQATYEIQASVHGRESLPKEIVEQAERAMLEVAHDDSAKAFAAAGTIIEHEIEIWHKLSTEGIALTGTPSGFADLDTITGGFQPGNLIVVAARPSMGKCLAGGTLVYDPVTGARRRLDAVVEALEAGADVRVASLGANLRLRTNRPITGVRNGVRPVFRLTTKLGRSVVATTNHPLLTVTGWKRLDELRPGDRVAVPTPRALARVTADCVGDPADQCVTIAHAAVAARGAATVAAAARGAGVPFARVGTTTSGTLDLWWDAVAAIEPAGAQETFDIDVPGDRNFVADDMVVHNSALVTNIAENIALHPERPMPVALFSLEMSEGELAQRFVASQASIEGDDLRKGRLKDERKWKKVLDAASRYDAAPLFVDDSSDIGVLEIRAKSRRLHQQMQTEYGGLGLIIVDYLQLMRPDGRTDNRVEQVSQMSRGLKILARELGVPVIALSQLSRAVENRPQDQRRPQLSDLRECVTGETLVVLADGRRVPIATLVGTCPEVVAVDERHRLITAQSDCVWSVGRRPTFRLRLASGRTLRATEEHRVLAGRGWTTVAELGPGDRVALARRLPSPEEPERWPDEHVVLLGQLIGDGSYLSGQPMRYTTASEQNSTAVRESAERAFGATVKRYAGRRGSHQLLISGNGTRWAPAGVNEWLRGLGIFDQRSHEKRVPEAAFRLPDDQIGLLLQHLWATDGTVWTSVSDPARARVSYATSSASLAADVCALLLRVGIVARRTLVRSAGSHRPMHHVVVSGADAQLRFLDYVGAFGPRVEGAERLLERLAFTPAATNVDTLPTDVWADVRRQMTARGVTTRAMAELRGTSYGGSAHFAFAPSRSTAAGYAALLDMPSLADASANDLFWDRVIAVEPTGEEDVYDLTVPGCACWLADGIVSHNSGAIEQDADLCVFIYRDEYYFPETTETPGEGELIIAKHRNGSLGTVNLVFQGKYTRFRSMSREYE